jgi:2,4-dienoyl-CoA reductase (NADPH2)
MATAEQRSGDSGMKKAQATAWGYPPAGYSETLKRLGVRILTSTKAKSIAPEGVWATRQDGSEELIPADSVVIALGAVSQNKLYEELKDEFPASYLVGDAKQVRTALEAIREGFDAGYSI